MFLSRFSKYIHITYFELKGIVTSFYMQHKEDGFLTSRVVQFRKSGCPGTVTDGHLKEQYQIYTHEC